MSALLARQARRAASAENLVLAGAALLLAVAVIGTDFGLFATDTRPDLYLAPRQALNDTLSAWVFEPYLGSPNYQSGLAPAAMVTAAMDAVGVPAWLIMRILRLALLVIAGWGARKLYHELAESGGPAGGIVAAVGYVANPFVIVLGSALPLLLPHAVLPWLVLTLRRTLAGWAPWRDAGLFALAFFAMGGENAGVVPLLLLATALPAVVLDLRLRLRTRWRDLLGGLARCALLAGGISLYWLLPSLSAADVGEAVAASTESLAIIAASSSYGEVLRGLGSWPLYGQGQNGPFQPEFLSYVVGPLVIIGSFTLAACAVGGAALSRSPARLFGVLLIVCPGIVAAGLYPYSDPSPFGRLLQWGFDHIGPLIAFRTTVKALSVLVLGCAVLAALLADEVAARAHGRPQWRWVALPAACGLLLSVAPVLSGGLYPSVIDVPGYWRQAARDIDADSPDGRVLAVPGHKLAAYRWRSESPDDVLPGLLARPVVVRTTVPATTPAAANFLAALDTPLQRGLLPAGALSTMARYLGVGDVLARHDLAWEGADLARPGLVAEQLAGDPGLERTGSAGRPGEGTQAALPAPDARQLGYADREGSLPPAEWYRVAAARPTVRAERARGQLLVVGDNAAVPELVAAGVAADGPAYRLLGGLTAAEFADVLGTAGRIVLTDTNQRRTWNESRPNTPFGPLLGRAEQLGPTRALFEPDDQTVARPEGGVTSASSSGSSLGLVPYGGPDLAFDGDPGTAWTTGEFGTGVGQWVEATPDRPVAVDRITIRVQQTSPVRISGLRVDVGGRSFPMWPGADGSTELRLPSPVKANRVRVTITSTAGDGINGVGVAEIAASGVGVRESARLPVTLDRLTSELGDADRARLARTPLDVLLGRDAGANTEGPLRRVFSLPDRREFLLRGRVGAGAGLTERTVDVASGVDPGVAAVSSTRAFGSLALRASQAFDDDPATAWVAGSDAEGAWVEARFPRRTISAIDLVQPTRDRPELRFGRVKAVGVSFGEGTTTAVASVERGTTRVTFPPQTTDRLRVQILGTDGAAGRAYAFAEIRVPGVRMRPATAPPGQRCVTVGTLDGRPLRARLTAPAGRLLGGGEVGIVGCPTGPVRLGVGQHRLAAGEEFDLRRVLLRDVQAPVGGTERTPVVVHGTEFAQRGTWHEVQVPPVDGPYYLVIGQAYDKRWRASLDGRPLGPPVLVDGYSVGWLVDEPGAHRLTVSYGPQRALDAGMAATAVTLLVAAALAVAGTLRLASQVKARAPNRRSRDAATVVPVLVLAVVGLGGGLISAGVAALIMIVLRPWRRPDMAGLLAVVGAVLVAATPIAFIVGNGGRFGSIGYELVTDNPWPHLLAGAGMALVLLGVAADVLGREEEP